MESPSVGMQEVQYPLSKGFTWIPKEEAFRCDVAPRKMRAEQKKL